MRVGVVEMLLRREHIRHRSSCRHRKPLLGICLLRPRVQLGGRRPCQRPVDLREDRRENCARCRWVEAVWRTDVRIPEVRIARRRSERPHYNARESIRAARRFDVALWREHHDTGFP